MNNLQVLKKEEQATADVLDGKTGAAGTELPLYDVCEQSRLPTSGFRGQARKSKGANCLITCCCSHPLDPNAIGGRLYELDRSSAIPQRTSVIV